MEKQVTSTELEGVNYPVYIKDYPNDHILQLPENANELNISLPLETYFNGSV